MAKESQQSSSISLSIHLEEEQGKTNRIALKHNLRLLWGPFSSIQYLTNVEWQNLLVDKSQIAKVHPHPGF
jgi:hypothetical protein